MKAVLYIHVTENCPGVEEQRSICHKYAAEHGYTILREYIDCLPHDIDAKHCAFNEMYRDSRKLQFSKILVYNAESFCHDIRDFFFYKISLAEVGVEVITVKESAFDEPCERFMKLFPQYYAEYKRKAHSESVKRGIRLAKERKAALAAQAAAEGKPVA